MLGATVTSNFGGLFSFRDGLKNRLQAAADEEAADMAADAAAEARGSAGGTYSTGAMAAACYWLSSTGGDYDTRLSLAKGLNKKAKFWPKPQPPPSPGALAGCAVVYAAAQNNGWIHARGGGTMPGDPFWSRAKERHRRTFAATVARHVAGHGALAR